MVKMKGVSNELLRRRHSLGNRVKDSKEFFFNMLGTKSILTIGLVHSGWK